MTRSKDKGTWAESAVVFYLQNHGWPSAERRALKGGKDQGDVTGTPGLCWEVKYTSGVILMKAWMRELAEEVVNSRADRGILVVKPPGYGDTRTGSWYAAMTVAHHDALIVSAGVRLRHNAPVAQSVNNLRQLHFRSDGLAYLTTHPPGKLNLPEEHTRVMCFDNAVNLLRFAGYGSPVEQAIRVS